VEPQQGRDPSRSGVTASNQSRPNEVSGINRHTHNVEFYGSSSSVALLSHVERTADGPSASFGANPDAGAIVSDLHNQDFSPLAADPSLVSSTRTRTGSIPASSAHYPQCRIFLQSFFTTIHYIHPILDKAAFLERCEPLWSGNNYAPKDSSFAALYYSLLAFGALVGTRDEEPIDGLDNLQWSRKFFDEAKSRCDKLGMVTDLEMVQCYFFLVGC
jgi:hypothetical protein